MFLQCKLDEFTCNDGICIKMDQRCDDLFDCSDKSDENNCKKVQMNEKSYRNDIIPNTREETVAINVSIALLGVNRIELPTTFDVKFILELTWKDYRNLSTSLIHSSIIDTYIRT